MSTQDLSLWRRWALRLRRDWMSHLATVLLAVVAFGAAHLWQTRNAAQGAAPDFSLPLLPTPAGLEVATGTVASDGLVGLAEWRNAHPGQAVALYLWADWCPICKLTEPSVSRVVRDWPVLTVAAQSADAPKLGQFMAQRSMNWVTAVDSKGEVGRSFGLGGVPAWIVVAPDGNISSVSVGYTTEWGMRWRLWWAQRQ